MHGNYTNRSFIIFPSSAVVTLLKKMKLRWTGHVARIEETRKMSRFCVNSHLCHRLVYLKNRI